ncbi:MAG TPA: hypothetical protein VF881_08715 [Polyangiaceae bacterium]
MNTPNVGLAAITLAVLPALVSLGCNKKEDEPLPVASVVPVVPAPPPPPAAPPPAVAPTAAPVAGPQVKTVAKGDSGARVAVAADGGALPPLAVGLPPVPTLHPSALPALASSIVGGIVQAIPSGMMPPPPPPAASK